MKTKLTGDSNQWSLISLNKNGLKSPIKRHRLTEWICKQNPCFFFAHNIKMFMEKINTEDKFLKMNDKELGTLKWNCGACQHRTNWR